MSKGFIIDDIKERFKGRESFTRKELFELYLTYEPELKENTFRWRIYDLKEKRIMRSLAAGLYTLDYRPDFFPAITESNKKLHDVLVKQFSGLKFCIWSTQILNEFMLHLPSKYTTILEVEKDALEPVFHFLQDIKWDNVFLQPDEKEMERYVKEKENAVIIKPLFSKSPLQLLEGVPTITLEKLIVDVYSDKKYFSAYKGSELAHIINNAYNRYAVDVTTLYNYAKRKHKDVELRKYLTQKTEVPNYNLND